MFKQIPNYSGYLINESGIVIDSDRNIIRTAVNNNGQLYTTLNSNIEFIDSLVAQAFLSNQSNYQFITHIDNDSLNCHLSDIRWSCREDSKSILENRDHRAYSKGFNKYEVFNEETNDSIICIGRGEVASLIQYEEISLKNMIGNGRKITMGPYTGYQIRRIKNN